MINLVSDMKNMIIRLFIFITLLITISANDGLCEIYKWIKDDGIVSFTDDLDKIPEEYREQAEVMKFKSDESETSKNSAVIEDTDIPADTDIVKEQEKLPEEDKTKTDEVIGGIDDK